MLCRITLAYSLSGLTPARVFAYCLRHNVMINVKYHTFATAILWENINNDTLTLWVKCYNGIFVRLRILL